MAPRWLVLLLLGTPLTAAFAAEIQLSPDIVALLDDAAEADLPRAALEAKAREGLAKGFPEPRVQQVLRSTLASWRGAAELLGSRADEPDRAEIVPAAAAALASGATDRTVREIAAQPVAHDALWALADIVFLGVAPERASTLVVSALGSADPALAMRELPEATAMLVAASSPDAAAAVLARALGRGDSPLGAVPPDKGGPPPHSNAGRNDKSKGKTR